jgi:AraC family transcriptional regulator
MDYADIRIVDFPATRVAVLRHRGDPALVDRTVERFVAWRRANGLPPSVSATFNIVHGGPDTTAPEDYLLDLCAATGHPIAPNEQGVTEGLIPAGRCAVLRHRGGEDGLGAAVAALCIGWLAASGERRADRPLFMQRVAFPPAVPPDRMVTDIFLPLR